MADDHANGDRLPEESRLENGLTPIHRRIHCAATPDDTNDHDETELDQIAIDHLLETLSEVAIAIVRRRGQLNQ